MTPGNFHKGTTTELHYNGHGRSILFHVNDRASLEEIMADGYFDLANKNRGNHPWIKPGDLIDVDAFDGYARLRVMTMDGNHASVTTLAVIPPVMFGQEPEKPAAKRGPGRPPKAETEARAAARNVN